MTKRDGSDFRKLYDLMDHRTRNVFIDMLIGELGEDRMTDLAASALKHTVDLDPESLERRAIRLCDIDDEELWDAMDELGVHYESEAADAIIIERFREEFEDDIRSVVSLGLVDDMEDYIRPIIRGLGRASGTLAEFADDTLSCMISDLEECLAHGCILSFFDEWR